MSDDDDEDDGAEEEDEEEEDETVAVKSFCLPPFAFLVTSPSLYRASPPACVARWCLARKVGVLPVFGFALENT